MERARDAQTQTRGTGVEAAGRPDSPRLPPRFSPAPGTCGRRPRRRASAGTWRSVSAPWRAGAPARPPGPWSLGARRAGCAPPRRRPAGSQVAAYLRPGEAPPQAGSVHLAPPPRPALSPRTWGPWGQRRLCGLRIRAACPARLTWHKERPAIGSLNFHSPSVPPSLRPVGLGAG